VSRIRAIQTSLAWWRGYTMYNVVCRPMTTEARHAASGWRQLSALKCKRCIRRCIWRSLPWQKPPGIRQLYTE
jgi:hypothetical protein